MIVYKVYPIIALQPYFVKETPWNSDIAYNDINTPEDIKGQDTAK